MLSRVFRADPRENRRSGTDYGRAYFIGGKKSVQPWRIVNKLNTPVGQGARSLYDYREKPIKQSGDNQKQGAGLVTVKKLSTFHQTRIQKVSCNVCNGLDCNYARLNIPWIGMQTSCFQPDEPCMAINRLHARLRQRPRKDISAKPRAKAMKLHQPAWTATGRPLFDMNDPGPQFRQLLCLQPRQIEPGQTVQSCFANTTDNAVCTASEIMQTGGFLSYRIANKNI